jgi:hypothetical protein
MSDLLKQPNLELSNQPFQLNDGGPHATVRLAAQLRCLKKPKPRPIELPKSIDVEPVDPPSKPEVAKAVDSTLPAPVPVTEVPATAVSSAMEKMRSPSLDEMVANTLEPIVKTTGHDIDLESIL